MDTFKALLLHHLRSRAYLAFFWLCLVVQTSVVAGAFHVRPIRLELTARQSSAALTLTNDGDVAVVVEAHLKRWFQQNNQDQLEDTDDLLVTPPVFALPPKATQILRVGKRQQNDSDLERTYRLFLEESILPSAQKPHVIQVASRLSIPVFVLPSHPTRPNLAWTVRRLDKNHLQVELGNYGNAHTRISKIRVFSIPDAQPLAEIETHTYLLPGQVQRWPIEMDQRTPFNGDRVHIVLDTHTGKLETDVVLDRS